MEQYKKDFISILRAVVCQDGTNIPADADWDNIWSLANKNHLEAVVYAAAPEEWKPMFASTYYSMVARTVRQEHFLEQMEYALSSAGVHYGLQKGSILKYDYPNPCLRFMSDMDLYIKPEDRPTIRTLMKTIGGVFSGTESGDEQFRFDGNLGVEFHGRLLYRKTPHGIENYPDWSLMDESKDRLTEEGYALNLIGHAVSDLSKGGPGIRYILDLWVYRHRHKPQPDWDVVWTRLQQDIIAEAAQNLIDLSEYLFTGEEATELVHEMADYILAGGLYGEAYRNAAAEAAKAGGKGKAVLRQFFRNREEFVNRYPWLRERLYLLPFAWILRGFNSLYRHPRIVRSWLNRMKAVNSQTIKEQNERLKRYGL